MVSVRISLISIESYKVKKPSGLDLHPVIKYEARIPELTKVHDWLVKPSSRTYSTNRIGIVVKRLLAKQETRVRFSYPVYLSRVA